jgi:putative adhesin
MARTATRTGHHGRTGVIAGAAVAAALVSTLAACGNDAGDDPHPGHRSFALHGRTLTVDSDDSALEIVSADVHTVEVTRWFRGTVVVGGDPRVTWAMKDDRLVLRLKCSGLVADCSARHRIEVPRGVAVKVEDGDGSVRARGFEEPLSIRTQDGSVQVTDSTGPLTLDSADGSVRATGVRSRRVHATTQDGSVHLELGAVPDLVESSSEDGSVTIALPHGTYRVSTRTQDGSVHVAVPRDPASSHVVDARTADGAVTVRTAG